MFFKTLIFFGFIFGLGILPAFAFAQSNLSISPLTFELTANPGDTRSSVIKIFNNGDTPANITMEVQDFAASGEGGEVRLTQDSGSTFALSHWIVVTPQTFVLEPNSFQTVEFFVNVPLDGEPGGHYGSILAAAGGRAEGTGAALAQKIGSLLLLQVAGDVQESMFLRTLEAPQLSERGPVTITSRFENTGSVHLKPRGFILIKNFWGKEVAKLELDQKNILPKSIRKIETVWDGEGFLFGRYDATLTAIYGLANTPISATTTFWVIPIKLVGGIGIGVFVFFVFLLLMRKRLKLAFSILFKGDKGS